MTSHTAAFGADSTTEDVLCGIDLSSITALVTGASAGLGVETARALAAHGATVIAASRDVAKAEKELAEVRIATGSRVTVEEVDLASLASVRSFTDRIRETYDRLNLIIANAGVMACPEGRTVDGFEIQFGTNHLGHFLLVNRLIPLLVAGAPSRVVCLSSAGHRRADIDLGDPNLDATPYSAFDAYGRSKTANILFAVALDRRMRDQGVRACAVHPGTIGTTQLMRHLDQEHISLLNEHSPNMKSVGAGAATTVWAAVIAEGEAVGGHYAEDCAVAPVSDEEVTATGGRAGVRSYAVDPDRAEALWAVSEHMVGEQFTAHDSTSAQEGSSRTHSPPRLV
jgi:NAD(P)-dependent dehydrogenase (short-subunit alcohol dehydrogenase family)